MKDGRPLRDVVLVTSRIERIAGARRGVFMPAHPGVGQSFAQEHYVKGIGQVKEATLKGGDERAELVAFRRR